MKGLIIRAPWIDLLIAGSKTWEMRPRRTSVRGRIALIKARSGLIVGTAELVECLPALSLEQMKQAQNFHAIPDEQLESAMENRWTTPWVLRDIIRLELPRPYFHPNGAVTWVDLPNTLTSDAQQVDEIMNPEEDGKVWVESRQSVPDVGVNSHAPVKDWADIKLTKANIRYSHFYLHSAERLLPSDCIGGPNKNQMAKKIRVRFEPGMLVESDVAGDKMILRSRAQVRDFFDRVGAKAGDHVRFGRIGHHEFVVTLLPAAT